MSTANQYEAFAGRSVALHLPRYCSLRFEERSVDVVAGYCRLCQSVSAEGVTTVSCEVVADARLGARLLESSRELGEVIFNEEGEAIRQSIPIELFGRVEGELYVEVQYRNWFEAEDLSLPTSWGIDVDGASAVREGTLTGAWIDPEFEFVRGDRWRFNARTPYFAVASERRGQSLVVSIFLRNWAEDRPAPVHRTLIRAKGQRRRER